MNGTTVSLAEMMHTLTALFGIRVDANHPLNRPSDRLRDLEACGAQVACATQYGHCMNLDDDLRVLRENTDARFWSGDTFLVAGEPHLFHGPRHEQGLLLRGAMTAEVLVAYWHAHVSPQLFIVDTYVLACATRQLLVVTHYGAACLFASPTATADP